MIPDLPLPPWARKIQQSPWFQFLILPLFLAGLYEWYTCVGSDFSHLSTLCAIDGLKAASKALVILIISGHSTGSASFHPDGTPNKVVENVVKVQQAVAADPTSPIVQKTAQDVAAVAAKAANVVG